jgi:D-aminopeptidase
MQSAKPRQMKKTSHELQGLFQKSRTIFSLSRSMQSVLVMICFGIALNTSAQNKKPRDLGIPFDGKSGKWNAITDVPGVEVGMRTIIKGQGKLVKGKGPVRTGVTAILPGGKAFTPVFANWNMLNGNGDLTGTQWITESGFLETPILITNTGSVGIVREGAMEWMDKNHYYSADEDSLWYSYPVVGETYDGVLNDIYGFHITKQDAQAALDSAKTGAVKEGNAGGGVGMICLGFKGGTGTSSRVIEVNGKLYTIGVLVQTNFGTRDQLTIAGVPVGRELKDTLNHIFNGVLSNDKQATERGSIIVVLATDAPLLPHQLKRITARIPLGISKTGGIGGNESGDIFLAFSTANKPAFKRNVETDVKMFPNEKMDELFAGTVQAVEEAIINSLFAAETLSGINNTTIYALPHQAVMKILKKYNRIR